VVCLWDTLEHLRSPSATSRRSRSTCGPAACSR
jgi:hypothetical protein